MNLRRVLTVTSTLSLLVIAKEVGSLLLQRGKRYYLCVNHRLKLVS